MKKPLPVSATSPAALYVMTETTEGLTRRMSSGSESSALALAAKKKRARSASHGGSLRFNIFRAFFSKRVGRTLGLLGFGSGGVQRAKPNGDCRCSAAVGRPFGDLKTIMT